jgi:hypothetical protein
MTRCRVCGKETPVTCICGFCPSCIAWKGHRGCQEEIENREEEKNE